MIPKNYWMWPDKIKGKKVMFQKDTQGEDLDWFVEKLLSFSKHNYIDFNIIKRIVVIGLNSKDYIKKLRATFSPRGTEVIARDRQAADSLSSQVKQGEFSSEHDLIIVVDSIAGALAAVKALGYGGYPQLHDYDAQIAEDPNSYKGDLSPFVQYLAKAWENADRAQCSKKYKLDAFAEATSAEADMDDAFVIWACIGHGGGMHFAPLEELPEGVKQYSFEQRADDDPGAWCAWAKNEGPKPSRLRNSK